MGSQRFSYLLLTILLLNLTALIGSADSFLNGTKESELNNSLGDDWGEAAKEHESVRKSDVRDVLLPPTKIRPLKGHTPPSTPPTGYIEDYVDALTDYHTPSDVGVIDDWTQMQATDGNYGNLSEGGGSPIETDTGLRSPSNYENASSGLDNPQNLYVSDDAYANSSTSGYVTVYDFNLPAGLTVATAINGIIVNVEAKGGAPTLLTVQLMWNGRSSLTSSKSQTVALGEAVKIYGGKSDTWERSWTGTDFTISNFGVKLSFDNKIEMDHVQVRIYYTVGSFVFDREFSFEPPPLYDEEQELCIKTGALANEDLNVDLWNSSASDWDTILNLQNSDNNTWKNVSLTSYLPNNSNFHFRFVDGTTTSDYTNDTWQIDAVLMKYKLIAPNFLRRRNITLDHTKVAATLTNFPVLIDLYDRGLHDHAQVNGSDILFTHSSGTKLAHEIETFNATYNGTHAHLIAWVEIPSLSNATDTVISMYFDNATIANQEHPRATWKKDFWGVWHLGELVTDEAFTINAHNDSASNTYHGNQDGNDDITSLLGQGQAFDGTDDLINVTADKNLDPSSNTTISGWFKLDTVHSSASPTSLLIMEKYLNSANNMHILLVGTDYTEAAVSDGSLVFKVETAGTYMYKWTQQTTWTADTWYYFVCTLDADNPVNNRIYVNGVDDTNSTYTGSATSLNLVYSADWGIGGGLIDAEIAAGEAWFDGVLDEMRVIPTIRTAAWIFTEYTNQNNSAGFYVIDLEEHMEDLDPPEIVALGVTDPGNGQPEFWAEVIDDFSGVASVNITLNGTEYEMTLNGSGYWVYQPPAINFNDYFSYFVNSSDFEAQFGSSSTENVRFDKDTVDPTVDEKDYYSEIGTYGTFNANVTDTWGIIDTVIVNVTEMESGPSAISAVMRPTASGYINDTQDNLERGQITFVIIVNDTAGNSITSTPRLGYYGANSAPMADNLTLTDPVHSNETLQLTYDFYDPDPGDVEVGTQIRWFKNGLLQPEHNDSTTIAATYLFKGDYWNVTVRPKDWKEFGPLEASNLVMIQNTRAVILDLHFVFEHKWITPFKDDREFVLMDEALNLSYTFFDADPTDSDESTINWYVNGSLKPEYTNWTSIPASETTPGDIYWVEIIPHDGDEASPIIQSKSIIVESRPMIHAYGVQAIKNEEEGAYYIWIRTNDTFHDLDKVEYELCINGLVVDGEPSIYRRSNYENNGTAQMWVLEFHLLGVLPKTVSFIDLLNTNVTAKVLVYTHVTYASAPEPYIIWKELSFNFTLMDEAPPRVFHAGVDWEGVSPTNVTFWANISEYGLGIDEVLLYYDFSSAGAQTKLFDLSHGPIPMVFNGTHWIATVSFNPNQRYEILFQISVFDLAGNSNLNAYPLGLDPSNRPDGIFNPPPQDITPLLIIGVIIIAIIGIAAVVAVRVFRKTELVGLDINKVMEASQQVSQEEIASAISGHTLGVVISTFDQLAGPIPLFVDPPILKDNFEKLIELSDRAFSAVRFIEDFEREIYTAFEIDFGIVVASISYGFALDRPEARGGAENISLNILIHKPFDALITKFADAYADDVHQIHMLMNKSTAENEQIARLVEKIRKTITAIILVYEEMYGSVEDVEEFELD